MSKAESKIEMMDIGIPSDATPSVATDSGISSHNFTNIANCMKLENALHFGVYARCKLTPTGETVKSVFLNENIEKYVKKELEFKVVFHRNNQSLSSGINLGRKGYAVYNNVFQVTQEGSDFVDFEDQWVCVHDGTLICEYNNLFYNGSKRVSSVNNSLVEATNPRQSRPNDSNNIPYYFNGSLLRQSIFSNTNSASDFNTNYNAGVNDLKNNGTNINCFNPLEFDVGYRVYYFYLVYFYFIYRQYNFGSSNVNENNAVSGDKLGVSLRNIFPRHVSRVSSNIVNSFLIHIQIE